LNVELNAIDGGNAPNFFHEFSTRMTSAGISRLCGFFSEQQVDSGAEPRNQESSGIPLYIRRAARKAGKNGSAREVDKIPREDRQKHSSSSYDHNSPIMPA